MKLNKKVLGLWFSVIMLISCLPMASAQVNAELHNVSLNKYVWASGYYIYGDASYPPTNAVDGNTGSEWAQGSTTSGGTVEGGYNYIAIDLLKSYPISEIRFYVRAGDTLTEARSNFKIEISENSDFTGATEVATYSEVLPYNTENIAKLAAPQSARYVRFIKTVGNQADFGMAEIAVMSEEENWADVARGKAVVAPYRHGVGGPQDIGTQGAVDGMPGIGFYDGGTYGNVSYWQVDLGEDYQKYELEEIIYRPGPQLHTQDPNHDFRIIMSADPTFASSVEVYRNSVEDPALVEGEELRIDLSEAWDEVTQTSAFQNIAAKTYRYVRVTSMAVNKQMTISEFSVLGRKIAGEGTNVALNKRAWSSESHTVWPYAASAVDGMYWPEGGDGSRWASSPYNKTDAPWIAVDLGGEYQLNSLVFQMLGADKVIAKDPHSYSNYVVELSMKEDFTDARIVHAQGSDPVYGRQSIAFDGDAGICRYIRIRSLSPIDGLSFHSFGVAELAAYSTDLPYTPTDAIEFLTSALDATPVSTVPEGDAFAVRFKGANTGETEKNVTLIQAGYTGENLASVKLYALSIPAGVSALPMVQSVSTAGAAGDSFRFYVWEDDTLKPLYQPGNISRAV